jgi:HEPN domain-containing protein
MREHFALRQEKERLFSSQASFERSLKGAQIEDLQHYYNVLVSEEAAEKKVKALLARVFENKSSSF